MTRGSTHGRRRHASTSASRLWRRGRRGATHPPSQFVYTRSRRHHRHPRIAARRRARACHCRAQRVSRRSVAGGTRRTRTRSRAAACLPRSRQRRNAGGARLRSVSRRSRRARRPRAIVPSRSGDRRVAPTPARRALALPAARRSRRPRTLFTCRQQGPSTRTTTRVSRTRSSTLRRRAPPSLAISSCL